MCFMHLSFQKTKFLSPLNIMFILQHSKIKLFFLFFLVKKWKRLSCYGIIKGYIKASIL